ncbi:MAG: hypothetical protein C4341_02685 [Armatimonadota bacterium]
MPRAGISFQEASKPQEARVHMPVEVHIQASGNWTNPYDPSEVSVSARIVGSNEVAAEVPGFWFEGYKWVEGRWSQTGERGWRLRFAPWNVGGYGLFVRGFDLDGPGELPRVGFAVRGVPKESEPPAYGFVEPVKDRPAFTAARREAFVPVGVYLDSMPLTPPEIRRVVGMAKDSGANLMSVPLFGAGWALEGELLTYDQQAAYRLDVLLEAAQEQGMRVMLRLEAGAQGAAPLPASLQAYAAEGGGACKTLDEFWTSLRARQAYKKKLRYIVARNAWRSSWFGVQFFEGVAPPAWWLDEMAQLVYDLHPYLVVQAAERNEQAPADSLRLNLALLSSTADLRRWRERSKKPAVLIPKPGEAADVRQAWRDVMAGASGAMTRGIPDVGSLAPLRTALHELPWTTAPVDAQRVESPYPFSAVLLSDSAVLLYVEGAPEVESQPPLPLGEGRGEGAFWETAGAPLSRWERAGVRAPASKALPQTIRVPIRRDGTYEAQWKDALTGELLGEPARARYRDSAELPVPHFDSAVVCVLRRVGR